jgi:L-ascorbate metabolism protein UlaG (beta-lactamase superfamily)
MQSETKYRLADSIIVEPLVNSWAAWSYLLSPLAASLHLANYQLKAMQEYLEDPELHVKASRDPAMIGGPYLDIPAARAGEVRQLLESTKQSQRHNLELARDSVRFYNNLVDEARGQSLEPFYGRLPETLRGYVELVYDYYNRPSVRFLEGLLYESRYYNKNLQSLRAYPLKRDNARSFFMSTPRLHDEDQFDWNIPFEDDRVDEFFKLDIEPQPLGRIRELLGLSEADDEKILPLLSEAVAARAVEKWNESKVRLRYFGHACVLVEWNGISVLTDPFIGVRPVEGGIERLSYGDLPDSIDYVLITHNHSDHFMIESLLRLRHRIKCLVLPKSYGMLHGDVSLKLLSQKLRFRQVMEMDSLDSINLPGGEIIAIPFLGEHGDLAHGKSGYIVRVGEERMMFGADSNCLDKRLYENLRSYLGDIETVFLGTECVGAPLSWTYGPLFPRHPQRSHDQSRRQRGCDSEGGIDILEAVGAKRFYNYGMGQEPWLEHILALGLSDDAPQILEADALIEKSRRRGFLVSERLFGKHEFYLEDSTAQSGASFPAGDEEATVEESRSYAGVSADGNRAVDDAEDNFVF